MNEVLHPSRGRRKDKGYVLGLHAPELHIFRVTLDQSSLVESRERQERRAGQVHRHM